LISTVFEQVRRIASDLFSVPADRIQLDSSPDTIEAWDSTQHLSLVLTIEETFNIQLSPEEIEGMKNIGETVRLIESKVRTR
jgi:acyl carrier protein